MVEQTIRDIHYLEDSDDEVFLCRLVLESEKMNVRLIHHLQVDTLEAALHERNDEQVTLVIVDFNMPGIKGPDAISRVLSSCDAQNLIIGICSGSEDPADKQASLKVGARFFVYKPLNTKSIKQICELCEELDIAKDNDGVRSIIAKQVKQG